MTEPGCCHEQRHQNRPHFLSASASNGAGSTTRGLVNLTTAFGGTLTAKISNGGTGPTVQAVVNVLIAHNNPAVGWQRGQ